MSNIINLDLFATSDKPNPLYKEYVQEYPYSFNIRSEYNPNTIIEELEELIRIHFKFPFDIELLYVHNSTEGLANLTKTISNISQVSNIDKSIHNSIFFNILNNDKKLKSSIINLFSSFLPLEFHHTNNLLDTKYESPSFMGNEFLSTDILLFDASQYIHWNSDFSYFNEFASKDIAVVFGFHKKLRLPFKNGLVVLKKDNQYLTPNNIYRSIYGGLGISSFEDNNYKTYSTSKFMAGSFDIKPLLAFRDILKNWKTGDNRRVLLQDDYSKNKEYISTLLSIFVEMKDKCTANLVNTSVNGSESLCLVVEPSNGYSIGEILTDFEYSKVLEGLTENIIFRVGQFCCEYYFNIIINEPHKDLIRFSCYN